MISVEVAARILEEITKREAKHAIANLDLLKKIATQDYGVDPDDTLTVRPLRDN